MAKEIGHRLHEEMVLSNLGVLFTHKGDYRQAMTSLRAAIDMGEGDERFWRYWVAHHYLGAAWMEMGCLDVAYDNLTVASEQLQQLGNRHYEVKARCDLGLVHHLAGRNQRAETGLTHVLGLIEGHGDLRFQALVNTRLGYVFELNREIIGSETPLSAWLRSPQPDGAALLCHECEGWLARIAASEGNGGDALDHVVTIWETIGNKEMDATMETARTLRTCYTFRASRRFTRRCGPFISPGINYNFGL